MTGEEQSGETRPMTNGEGRMPDDPKPEEAKPDDRREEVASAVAACIGGLWSQGRYKASDLIDGTAMALGELVLAIAMSTGTPLKRLLVATYAVVDGVANPPREPLPPEEPEDRPMILLPGGVSQ